MVSLRVIGRCLVGPHPKWYGGHTPRRCIAVAITNGASSTSLFLLQVVNAEIGEAYTNVRRTNVPYMLAFTSGQHLHKSYAESPVISMPCRCSDRRAPSSQGLCWQLPPAMSNCPPPQACVHVGFATFLILQCPYTCLG